MAGSVAIHIAVLIVIFQFRSTLEANLNRYYSVTLYVPPVESVPAAVPTARRASVLLAAPPPVLSPPVLLTKLAPPPKPALDLPAPPDLPATRISPFAAPVPAPPVPASPVFASALPATPSTLHSVAPRTGSFGSVPTATATVPSTAKPQIVGDTFNSVPAVTHPARSNNRSRALGGIRRRGRNSIEPAPQWFYSLVERVRRSCRRGRSPGARP